MKAKFAKQVRKLFSEQMEENLPMFRQLNQEEVKGSIPPGDRLYLWDYCEELYFYLVLCFAAEKMGDAFSVECAFTKHKKFPSHQFLAYPRGVAKSDIEPSVPSNGNMRFRIGYLFEYPRDYWWWVRPNPSLKELNEWMKQPVTKDTLFIPQKVTDQEAMASIEHLVKDAIVKIKEYAMPYFGRIIEDYDNTPDFWSQFEPEGIDQVRERILRKYGGEAEAKCIWRECPNKRLKESVYCVEHLPEFVEIKSRRSTI